jgi:hypothetical protein
MNKLFALFLAAGVCLAQQPAPSGWVVIPIKDYETLRGKASPPPERPLATPVEATLTRIDYDLNVEGPVASGQATLTVDVLRPGWVSLPLPQGLLVRDARMNGQSIVLVSKPGNVRQLSAVLARPGRSSIVLNVGFAVTSTGAEERLSLPAGKSGVTQAAVRLAGRDLDVTVTGGYLAERSPDRWLAYAKGSNPLTFQWRKRSEERPREQVPTRMRASLIQLFGLGEDMSTVSAEVDMEVVQGAAQQIKLAVPSNVIVNQVPGANIADWKIESDTLTVSFLDPVERSAKFIVSGEIRLPSQGAITIPVLRVLDAERETGGVAVEMLGAGEIKNSRARGLDPADAAALGQTVAARQSPSLVAFRLRPITAPALELDVARYDQQAVLTANIEEARYRVLLTADGKTLVQARYAVRNNQRNFLSVRLPAGASLWSTSLAGQPARPGKTPDGALLIPLAKGRAGDEAPPFGIEMMYSVDGIAWTSKGDAALPLPVLDLPVSRSGLVLYVPPLYRVTPQTGAFRLQPYEPPASQVLNNTNPAAAIGVPSGGPPLLPNAQQALVDQYRVDNVARRTGERLPLRVSFPARGPSGFLASELTAENTAPVIQLKYQEDKVGGVR